MNEPFVVLRSFYSHLFVKLLTNDFFQFYKMRIGSFLGLEVFLFPKSWQSPDVTANKIKAQREPPIVIPQPCAGRSGYGQLIQRSQPMSICKTDLGSKRQRWSTVCLQRMFQPLKQVDCKSEDFSVFNFCVLV